MISRRAFIKSLATVAAIAPVATTLAPLAIEEKWVPIYDAYRDRCTFINGFPVFIKPYQEYEGEDGKNYRINPEWVRATHEIELQAKLNPDGTHPSLFSVKAGDVRVVILERKAKCNATIQS